MKNIYMIENKVNRKVYVGQTSKTINERFKQHIRDMKKEKCKNRGLYKDMLKYGIDKFEIKLLSKCSNNIANEMEIYYISKYESFNNGYNNTYGGSGKHFINHDKIIKEYKKYQNIKEVSILNNCHRDTVRDILKKNNMKIKPNNETAKEKCSKKVIQKDKNGNLINKFESVTDASLYLGNKNYIPNITRVCNGLRKTCKGYIWEYL